MKDNLLSVMLTLVDSNPGGDDTRHCKVMRRYTYDSTYGDPLCNTIINSINHDDCIIECQFCPLGFYSIWKKLI